MKLKYSICCGLDVHKNVIVATIVITNKDGISKYKQKSFSTIIKNNCYHVCMESTGKYWIPISNYLENNIDVCLTHPKYVKAIKGKKTDKKDSKWIAGLYKFDLVRCSFIPPKDFRQLRELARLRFKLVCMKSSEKNRIQNCMTASNIGIASILSDPLGKTATQIMSYLLEHTADSVDETAVRKLIKKSGCPLSDSFSLPAPTQNKDPCVFCNVKPPLSGNRLHYRYLRILFPASRILPRQYYRPALPQILPDNLSGFPVIVPGMLHAI